MSTPSLPFVEPTNSPLVDAFIQEPKTDIEQLARARFVRGVRHLQYAAERRALVAEVLLLEGGIDPRFQAANTSARVLDSEMLRLLQSAEIIAADPGWLELVSEQAPQWAAFRAKWEADRAAEQAASDTFNTANVELAEAEEKFTEAVAGGDDKQLATARARLLEARKKVESSRRSLR
jgi:hypothetical protein